MTAFATKHRYGDENVKVLPSRCRPECSVNIFITISNVRLVVNSNLSSIFLRRLARIFLLHYVMNILISSR